MRRRVVHPTSTTGVSPVVQDGVRDASIQRMVERTGGIMPQGNRQPVFGDFSHPAYTDYLEALNLTRTVREHFDRLPSGVRAEFHNSPAALGAALDNPIMQDRMVELGLREKPLPVLRPDPEANPHKESSNEA